MSKAGSILSGAICSSFVNRPFEPFDARSVSPRPMCKKAVRMGAGSRGFEMHSDSSSIDAPRSASRSSQDVGV